MKLIPQTVTITGAQWAAVENLAWGTLSDNAQDALRNGGRATGPDSTSPLAVEDVQLIRQSPESSRVLADRLGVSHTTIQKISFWAPNARPS